MGLSNNQYDRILRDYDKIRFENNRVHLQRIENLRVKAPEYFALEDQLRSIRMKRVQLILNQDNISSTDLPNDEIALRNKRNSILESLELPFDYLSPIYNCPICKDRGFLSDNHTKCQCFLRAQTKLLFEQSGILDLIESQNFSTLHYDYFNDIEKQSYQKAVLEAQKFIINFNTDYQNLIFCGNVGTGKTFLSCCIAKELMEQGCSVLYLSAEQFFRNLVDYRFLENKEKYRSFLEDISNYDLLVLDDLGTESITERVKSDLFTCLNTRELRKKSTIISTNLTVDELNKRYSERIFSRVSSHFNFCKFDGRDLRIIKKYQEKRK